MSKILIKKNKKFKIEITNTPLNQKQVKKTITVKGPLGNVSFNHFETIHNNNNKFFVKNTDFAFFTAKLKDSIKSVTTGWFKELNLNGLGFKSFKLDDKIALDLGYSNLILYKPDSNVKVKNFKNKIILFSLSKEHLGNVCNHLQNFAKPDAYKGKGILFKNEIIKLKKKSRS